MVKFTSSQFSHIGQRIAYKQDKNLSLTVDELLGLVKERKLLPWIELNICSLDFWDGEARQIMEVELEVLAYDEFFGIENNGLSLLMAYCYYYMENLPTRTLEDL